MGLLICPNRRMCHMHIVKVPKACLFTAIRVTKAARPGWNARPLWANFVVGGPHD